MSEHTSGLIRPRVYFEPGIHQTDPSARKATLEDLAHGDVNAHTWNSEVKNRIIGYKPDILAIDSITPFQADQDGEVKLSYSDKQWIWYMMPGTPMELNGSDRITILAGDNTYGAPNSDSEGQVELDFGSALLLFNAAGGLGAVADSYIHSSRKWYRDYNPRSGQIETSETAPRINRRHFFMLAGYMAAAAGFVAEPLSADTAPRGAVDAEIKLDDIYEPLTLEYLLNSDDLRVYSEGRTALVLSKMLDVPNIISGELNGSVVMGDGHDYDSDKLQTDKQLRIDLIANHYETIIKQAETAKHLDYFAGHWTYTEKKAFLRLQELSIQFISVEQPDELRFKNDPRSELNRIITFGHQMRSPTVAEAIDSL